LGDPGAKRRERLSGCDVAARISTLAIGDQDAGPEREKAERANGPDLVYITLRYVKPKAEDGLGEGKGR